MRCSDWSSDVCSSDLVEVGALVAAQLGDLRQLLDDADLVVHRHDGDHGRLLGHGLRQQVEVDQPIGADRQHVDAVALARELLDALQHALVLAGQGHGVGPPLARSEEHTSELQSLMRISYAVFCLKKKKKKHNIIVLKRISPPVT